MKLFVLCSCLFVVVLGSTQETFDAQGIIEKVNAANTTWKAGHNFPRNTPLRYIIQLIGHLQPAYGRMLPVKTLDEIPDSELPENFDSRMQWPECPTIKHILDQGGCGACWAVAAASTFSDRLCIATKGQFKEQLSAEELMTCCTSCGYGCHGGAPELAWEYFKQHGVVTGGDYHSKKGCQPYQIEPCQHHGSVGDHRRPCPALHQYVATPECKVGCTNPDYQGDFEDDHHKVKSVYYVTREADIQKEILTNGPVEAGFAVFEDLLVYKSGVYQYTSGKFLGGHAIRVIGWGTEDGTPYWLVANSWNSDWGDNGTFKIIRGTNELGIEERMVAGEPEVY